MGGNRGQLFWGPFRDRLCKDVALSNRPDFKAKNGTVRKLGYIITELKVPIVKNLPSDSETPPADANML